MKTLKDLGDLKTIKALREQGAKVILMAHLGRPKGKVVPELSLAPVAARLGELLGITVPLAADTYGEDAQAKVAAMSDGDVVLLQNVRFNPEETSKDPEEQGSGGACRIRQEDRRPRRSLRVRRLRCRAPRTGFQL